MRINRTNDMLVFSILVTRASQHFWHSTAIRQGRMMFQLRLWFFFSLLFKSMFHKKYIINAI